MPNASPHILVIDADREIRALLARYLSRGGWTVTEADRAETGFDAALQGPQAIIVDSEMPDGSAGELCQRLKSDPRTRSIPIVQTSRRLSTEAEIADGFNERSADAYLTEPIDPRGLVSTIRALLRLRNAEGQANINSAKLEAVIRSMIEGVITADTAGNYLSMNPAALQIYGFANADEIPRTPEEQNRVFSRVHLDGRPVAPEELPIMRAARGEIVRNCEMRVTRRDTGRSWIGNFNATTVHGSDGNSDVVIMTVFDISDRKRAEVELREAQETLKNYAEQLEQKVADRTSSLREAINQMEEFSYTVSHDLRAPLRSIKGYAEVLVHDYSHKLKGDGTRFLERIIENGNRMERLVNDVLTISRISSAKLRLEPLALQPILQSIVSEYPNLHPSVARIRIDPLPSVIGHESLCIQVFANLLTNAAKFVGPGKIPEIQVWAERRETWVRINLRDNGIGISPEFHEKIFGMFERLDPENRYGGTGIGLAIVRRAVEKMNGRVGVDSDGLHGSLFWVELPAAT